MEIKQLEYFRAIVEAGTISGAARTLHMTQPPLSYQMKMLEEELQVQLFVRGTKRIALTEAGEALYIRAGSLLAMADITKREVVKASQAATLHIGMTPSTVSMMAEQVAAFSERYPGVHFDIHEGSTFTLRSELENGVVDLTTLRTPISLSGFTAKSLVREPLLAMMTPKRLKASGLRLDASGMTAQPETGQSVSLSALSKERLILSHRYRKYMLNAFEESGLSCDIYYECEDARTAMTLAEMGVGIAILPASMQQLTDQVVVCAISGADLTTEILLAWREEKLSPEVQAFIQMVQENVDI